MFPKPHAESPDGTVPVSAQIGADGYSASASGAVSVAREFLAEV